MKTELEMHKCKNCIYCCESFSLIEPPVCSFNNCYEPLGNINISNNCCDYDWRHHKKSENIKGKWQTVAIGGITNGIRCSVCKQTTVVPADRTRKMNFCPECGADMRVVKE